MNRRSRCRMWPALISATTGIQNEEQIQPLVVVPLPVSLPALHLRSEEYKSGLRSVATALQARDVVAVQDQVDRLVSLDAALSQELRSATGRVKGAAQELAKRSETQAQYAALGRQSSHLILDEIAVY